MKALTCEMCGSANIVKEGDFYVCQSCGTKFAAEKKPREAATQAVQQPVIPTSNVRNEVSGEIERLYEMARITRRNNGDFVKLYKEILEKDPNGWGNWEVIYYAYWGDYKEMSSRLPTILGLVKNHVEGAEQQQEILKEILSGNTQWVMKWKKEADKKINNTWEIYNDYSEYDINHRDKASNTYANALIRYANFMYAYGDETLRLFGKEMSELFVDSWETASGLLRQSLDYSSSDGKKANKKVIKEYEKKIQQYTVGNGEPVKEKNWLNFENIKENGIKALKFIVCAFAAIMFLGLLVGMCRGSDDKSENTKTQKADSVIETKAIAQEQVTEETIEVVANPGEEDGIGDGEEWEEEPDISTMRGTIGDYPITMEISIGSDEVHGSYYYDKQGPDKRLNIAGVRTEGKIALFESDANGEVTGSFKGELSEDGFEGVFETKDGKKFPFKVSE